MKAVYAESYGPPEELRVIDRPIPTITDRQVLVRVHAAALHVGDCFTVRGRPFVVRMETGWRRPRVGIPGYDFSGVVESVGANVDDFHPGDEVFGYQSGSCAEYVAADVNKIDAKPPNVSHVEAASVVTSGLTAFHALRDIAKVGPGHSVLINGASGGIGTFAVQIAKTMEAEVTGVCSGKHVSMVRSLGADHVIDYQREDFTYSSKRYDCVLDNVENRDLSEVRSILKPNATLICNSGTGAVGLAFWIRLLRPLMVSPFVTQRLCRFVSTPNQADLRQLMQKVVEQKVRPVIAAEHSMDEVPDALRMLEQGHTAGKRVVVMPGASSVSVAPSS